MAKAYWIASVEVSDPVKYKGYADAAPEAFKKFGAKYLARGGKFQQLEGEGRSRNVVVEFPSLQAAEDCFNSPEYKAAKAKRAGAATISVVIVEGVE
jgi:uncharacterized protein (DUF1330 family)